MAERKDPVAVEVESVLTQAFRSGLGRVRWQDMVEQTEHRKTLGGIVSGSTRTLKGFGVKDPVDALAGALQEKVESRGPPGDGDAPQLHLAYALALFVTELSGLVWGYTNYGGRRETVPDDQLTPFEAKHGLSNPMKWRQFAAGQLRELGFLPAQNS